MEEAIQALREVARDLREVTVALAGRCWRWGAAETPEVVAALPRRGAG